MKFFTFKKFYYFLKPLIPRWLQVNVRSLAARITRKRYKHVWPINENSGKKPFGWQGWPKGKQFSLVLTHDVDTKRGHDRCKDLANLEMAHGFRSSFNFVPKRYSVSPELRKFLTTNGFEIGLHGLYHDGKKYNSFDIFKNRALETNTFLNNWDAVGFRSPSMHHNLEWIHLLDIEYDMSTFDTDPFEPQSDGMSTIFPFIVESHNYDSQYVELPYTLPQDFTLFILFQEKNIDIWKEKIDWIVDKGGMALVNVHPDYMNFKGSKTGFEEYPSKYYVDFLTYVKNRYSNQYWNPLPKEIAKFWKIKEQKNSNISHK